MVMKFLDCDVTTRSSAKMKLLMSGWIVRECFINIVVCSSMVVTREGNEPPYEGLLLLNSLD